MLSDFCWTFKKIYSKYLLILEHFCATLHFNLYRQERLWLESIWCRSMEVWNGESKRIWNVKLMPSKARLEIFFWKNTKKGPKIHCLALDLYTGPPNCITGASKSGGQWGGPPLDLLVKGRQAQLTNKKTTWNGIVRNLRKQIVDGRRRGVI